MPLPITPGITYTELTAIRKQVYADRGPELLRRTLRALADLKREVLVETIDRLNDLSLELEAMEPGWKEFSFACFQASLYMRMRGTQITVDGIQRSFDLCFAQLSAKSG